METNKRDAVIDSTAEQCLNLAETYDNYDTLDAVEEYEKSRAEVAYARCERK